LANDIKRRENAASAAELFRQALELDPDNVDALVGVSSMCSYQVVNLYGLNARDPLLDGRKDLRGSDIAAKSFSTRRPVVKS
jgi:hypothetical protein